MSSNAAPVAKKTATVPAAYTKIIEEMKASKTTRTRSLGQYYSDWNAKAKQIEAEEEAEAFFKNINPKDIGFTTGAAMTEEEFKAYRNRTSGPSFADMYNAVHAAKRSETRK